MKRTILLLPIILLAIASSTSAQVVESYQQASFTARCWRTEPGNIYDSWVSFRVTKDLLVWEAGSFETTHSYIDMSVTFTDTLYPIMEDTWIKLELDPYQEMLPTGRIRRTWRAEMLVGYGDWAFGDSGDMYYDITSAWRKDVWARDIEHVIPFPGQQYPMRVWPAPDMRTNIGACIDYDAMQYEYNVPITLGGGDTPSAALPPSIQPPGYGYPYPAP